MKGLLIKDFMLVKNQKQFFVIAMVMTVVLMVSNKDTAFATSYGLLMFSMLVITTINYDKYEKGMGYLFTLPVSRKKYVQEKYVFAIIMMLVALTIIAVILAVVTKMQIISTNKEELFLTIGAASGTMFLMDSVMIPLQIKFESERMQAIYIAVFGITFASAYLFFYITKEVGINIDKVIETIITANLVTVMGVWVLFIAAMVLISYLVSQRIMRKKDF